MMVAETLQSVGLAGLERLEEFLGLDVELLKTRPGGE